MVWGSRARSRPRVGFGEGSSIERLREEEGEARRGGWGGVEGEWEDGTERSGGGGEMGGVLVFLAG